MPRISEFFGIVIYMYWMDIQKHQKPHFHARFKGKEAVFDGSNVDVFLPGDGGDWPARS